MPPPGGEGLVCPPQEGQSDISGCFSTADRLPSSKRVEIVDDFGSVSVEQCNSQVSYLYHMSLPPFKILDLPLVWCASPGGEGYGVSSPPN